MRNAAVVRRHRFISHVNEVLKGCAIRARRERRGASVRAVVVLQRSEAKHDRKKRFHPHPDARHRRVCDWPGREEDNVPVRQVKDDVCAKGGDKRRAAFGEVRRTRKRFGRW